MNPYANRVYQGLCQSLGHEVEFLQAVSEFFIRISPVLDQHPEYEADAILERLVEPERIISFRVPWLDDQGYVHVNRGYRIQFSSLVGPYKGGLRFHPSVNQGVLKFLGFEQIFKNYLTGLPIGGAKGGADFDPKGKSDREIMRFCQSFMTELSRHIGPELDVPAGDIGVGAREIGYLFGQYKRLKGPEAGVLTGKPINLAGSFIRPEATGYGLLYFLLEMLNQVGETLSGKTVLISGSGNVAYYAAQKAIELGARVVSMSDSTYALYDPKGINLATIKHIKFEQRERINLYQNTHPQAQITRGSIWDLDIQADIALPCATQNEINGRQAQRLLTNGIQFVAEGANMPCDAEATALFNQLHINYGPAKAANAGGVAVSALEMSQNAQRLSWSSEVVDQKLQEVMTHIFSQCAQAAARYNLANDYAAGADIAAFEALASIMQSHGLI